MERVIYFLLGCMVFVSCAAAQINFPLKWYHASPVAVWDFPSGKLLGEKPEDDKLLADCVPTKNADGKLVQKCGVVFLSDLESLIIDYKQSKQRIIDLERQCGGNR